MEQAINEKSEENGTKPQCEEFSNAVLNVECCSGEEKYRRRYLVNFLVMIFGIGACIGVNGLVAEGPLMVMSAPEGSRLPSKMSSTIMLSYVAPALYALYNRSSNARASNDSIWILGILLFGTVSIGLLAFFYGVVIVINNVGHSVVMMVLGFASSSVSGVRNILFMPYLRNFEEVHLTAFFIGEGLSGFIPSIVALIQGVGDDPICPNKTANSTEPFVPYIGTPNFPPRDYYLFIFALMVSSVCAFLGLEYLRVQTSRRPKSVKFDYDPLSTEERNCTTETLGQEKSDETKMTDGDLTSNPGHSSWLRIYLCTLMWLVCLMAHGYLSSVEAFSSRPYGNSAHNMVANLSQLASTATCVVALWLPSVGIRGITWLVGLVYVGSFYVTWLGMCSPNPPWRDETFGVVHLVTIWTLLFSLVSYVKLTITTVVWKETSDAGLFQIGFALLVGAMCSCMLAFFLVNYTTLFTPYAPCRLH